MTVRLDLTALLVCALAMGVSAGCDDPPGDPPLPGPGDQGPELGDLGRPADAGDAGRGPDSEGRDLGPLDGGPADIASPDGGPADGGPADGGPADGGQTDLGRADLATDSAVGDGGSDSRPDTMPPCGGDDDCDDGRWCNGQERCSLPEGSCLAGDPPCDDEVECTEDECQEEQHACAWWPEHGACLPPHGFCHEQRGCVQGLPEPGVRAVDPSLIDLYGDAELPVVREQCLLLGEDDLDAATLQAAIDGAGRQARVIGRLSGAPVFQVWMADNAGGPGLAAACQELGRLQGVRSGHVHFTGLAAQRLPAAGRDEAYVQRGGLLPAAWHLGAIGAPAAWDLSTGSPQTAVGLVDFGFDLSHPDLRSNVAGCVEQGTVRAAPCDQAALAPLDPALADHGTALAGLLAAEGDSLHGAEADAVGVMWQAGLVLGRASPDLLGVLAQVEAVAASGAGVVALGLGHPWLDAHGEPLYPALGIPDGANPDVAELVEAHEVLVGALLRAHPGLLLVQSGGNDGRAGIDARLNLLGCAVRDPELAERVLCVAGATQAGARAPYSNLGGDPLAAPAGDGDAGLTTLGWGGTLRAGLTGSSLAAAQVAGVAGLMRSLHPQLEPAQLHAILTRSSTEMDGDAPAGLLNAEAAVTEAERCLHNDWSPEDGGCPACAPACEGLQCGPDPRCGLECGPCPEGLGCAGGRCVYEHDFPVNTVDDQDDGACTPAHCSLREALRAANATPEADVLLFELPGDPPWRFVPLSPLPEVTAPLRIEGHSAGSGAGPGRGDPGDPRPGVAPTVVLDGRQAGPEADGLLVSAVDSAVLGLAVVGFAGHGVLVAGAGGATVEGCYLGVEPDGVTRLGNGVGLGVWDSGGDVIGGPGPAEGNVISGNKGAGVVLLRTHGARVLGNRIGSDATGAAPLGNGGAGILAEGTSATTIGGAGVADANVLAGNQTGVLLREDAHGQPCVDDHIVGNRVGTDATGVAPLPNLVGVEVQAGRGTVIGGSEHGAGNLIAGNKRDGVLLRRPATRAVVIEGNRIGTDGDGARPLPNGGAGVRVVGGAGSLRIGGVQPAMANHIAHNRGGGVVVGDDGHLPPDGVAVLGNSIHSNQGLGIDLGTPGPMPLDVLDVDQGPNGAQNWPLITLVLPGDGDARVEGVLHTEPGRTYRVELFVSSGCDPSGHGQAARFVASHTLDTDWEGRGVFALTVDAALQVGDAVTATATPLTEDGAPARPGGTSELSRCWTLCPGSACEHAACGLDACGNLCGVCRQADACVAGECECRPRCRGFVECGDDGCGGVCGHCPGDSRCFGTCTDGVCGPPEGDEGLCVDQDGDGHLALAAGGGDCDDEDPLAYPGAPDWVAGSCAGDLGVGEDGWHREVAGDPGSTGGAHGLALDASGQAHLLAVDNTTGMLRHGAPSADGWAWTPVGWVGTEQGPCHVGIDELGHLHAALRAGRPAALLYATNASGEWTLEPVAEAEQPQSAALAVGPEGTPHLAWIDTADEVLLHATPGLEGWEVDTAVGAGPKRGVALAVDRAGQAVVAYQSGLFQAQLRVARQQPDGSWSDEVADGSANAGGKVSLALGLDGAAHLLHYVWLGERLTWVVYTSDSWGDWSSVPVSPAHLDTRGVATAIAIGAGDAVHLAYHDEDQQQLHYALLLGGEWFRQRLDEQLARFPVRIDMASGAGRLLRVAYNDASSGELKLASNQAPCEGLDDERDMSCDGVDGVDADGDGAAGEQWGGDDCDDGDPAVRPGGRERCDDEDEGRDDNCDGEIDEGCAVRLAPIGTLFPGEYAEVEVIVAEGTRVDRPLWSYRILGGDGGDGRSRVVPNRQPVLAEEQQQTMLLAGSQAGEFTLQLRTEGAAGYEVLTEQPFEVSHEWTLSDSGPASWTEVAAADPFSATPSSPWGANAQLGVQGWAVDPVEGPWKVLLLFVHFSDVTFPDEPGWIDNMRQFWLAQAETGWGDSGRSVAAYYDEVSRGRLQVEAEVAGPILLPVTFKEFFGGAGWAAKGHVDQALLAAALQQAHDFAGVDSVAIVTPTWHLPPLPCLPTNGGVEACDGVDNDCDGATDAQDPTIPACAAIPICGDGVVDWDPLVGAFEQCDDGNADPWDYCDSCVLMTHHFAWPEASLGQWQVQYAVGGNGSYGLISLPAEWTDLRPGRTGYGTLAHELGHNLGLPDTYDPVVADRQVGEWDVMDSSRLLPHLPLGSRLRLGWLDPGQVISLAPEHLLDEVTPSLHPVERTVLDPTRYAGLELRMGPGWSMFFEYRLGQGGQVGDRAAPVPQQPPGVLLATDWGVGPPSPRPDVLLAPQGAGSDGVVLQPGQTWQLADPDPLHGASMQVRVLAADADGADLQVDYGPTLPDLSLRPANPPSSVSLDVSVSNQVALLSPDLWWNVPWPEHPNDLVATVYNGGMADAPGVYVDFTVLEYGVGLQPNVQAEATIQLDVPAGEAVPFVCPGCWTPDASPVPQYCVVASVRPYVDDAGAPAEVTTANNTAKSCYSQLISTTASPSQRVRQQVLVGNPLDSAAYVHLSLAQTRPDYRAYLEHGWVHLEPGEQRSVSVMVEYAGDLEAEVAAGGLRAVPANHVHLSAFVAHPALDEREGRAMRRIGDLTTQVHAAFPTTLTAWQMDIQRPLLRGSVLSAALDSAAVPDGVVLVEVEDSASGASWTTSAEISDGNFVLPIDAWTWSRMRLRYLGSPPYGPSQVVELVNERG